LNNPSNSLLRPLIIAEDETLLDGIKLAKKIGVKRLIVSQRTCVKRVSNSGSLNATIPIKFYL